MMADGVSVIICCYNSAQRLPETLRHLAAQQISADFPWEIIVIDNASTDGTAEAASCSWPPNAPAQLRVILEPVSGLSHARIRGIREARYGIISFIDDDNWVASDWIQRVATLFSIHQEICACGGRIAAACEITLPPWFESVQDQYAVGRQHGQSGDITDTNGTLLCGAGLNLRTAAVRKLFDDGFVFKMTGRKGVRLLGGEDTELCFALRASGWRFWYDDELNLRHFIPKARLQWPYAVKLMRGMGESGVLISLYALALKVPPFETYPMWKKSWLFQFFKSIGSFVRVAMAHPMALLGKPEDSVPVLVLEKTKGQLAGLWTLCGEYGKLQDDIRRSTWARRGSAPSA